MTLTRVSAKKRKRVFLLRADGKYFKNGGSGIFVKTAQNFRLAAIKY